jgi:hypothetical protein
VQSCLHGEAKTTINYCFVLSIELFVTNTVDGLKKPRKNDFTAEYLLSAGGNGENPRQ